MNVSGAILGVAAVLMLAGCGQRNHRDELFTSIRIDPIRNTIDNQLHGRVTQVTQISAFRESAEDCLYRFRREYLSSYGERLADMEGDDESSLLLSLRAQSCSQPKGPLISLVNIDVDEYESIRDQLSLAFKGKFIDRNSHHADQKVYGMVPTAVLNDNGKYSIVFQGEQGFLEVVAEVKPSLSFPVMVEARRWE